MLLQAYRLCAHSQWTLPLSTKDSLVKRVSQSMSKIEYEKNKEKEALRFIDIQKNLFRKIETQWKKIDYLVD